MFITRHWERWGVVFVAAVSVAVSTTTAEGAEPTDKPAEWVGAPIAIHPTNPHYFLFRGKPLVLINMQSLQGIPSSF